MGRSKRLLPPLQALTALLPEVVGVENELLLNALEELEDNEAAALRQFAASGKGCMSALSESSLEKLRRSCIGASAISRSQRCAVGTPTFWLDSEKSSSPLTILECFDRFDKNKDGVLNAVEFKAFLDQTHGGEWSDAAVKAKMGTVDINDDGVVDLHEFAVFMYSEAKQRSPRKEGSDHAESRILELHAKISELTTAMEACERENQLCEEQLSASADFLKQLAMSASGSDVSKLVDLGSASLVGSGKYAHVLSVRSKADDRPMAVKVMGMRWNHIASQEWHAACAVAHPLIVASHHVALHVDEKSQIKHLFSDEPDRPNTRLADRYVCILQEFMNRGNVQTWLEEDRLSPEDRLFVIRQVAKALAHMHKMGFAHNDIKPANILLHQQSDEPSRGLVTRVKLADFSLSKRSHNRALDFQLFGVTMVCLITGERFGDRKFRPECVEDFIADASAACAELGTEVPAVSEAYKELPRLILKVFRQEVTMLEVADWTHFGDLVPMFEGSKSKDIMPALPQSPKSPTHRSSPSNRHRQQMQRVSSAPQIAPQRAATNRHGCTNPGSDPEASVDVVHGRKKKVSYRKDEWNIDTITTKLPNLTG